LNQYPTQAPRSAAIIAGNADANVINCRVNE
jgi:hypothetical protein